MLAGASLLGCDQGRCNSTRSALLAPDGGQVICLRAEDCPLTGTLLVCVDTGEPNHLTPTCARCVENACVQDTCVP